MTDAQPIDGCPGQYLRVQARCAGICIGCARYDQQTPAMIPPRAAYSNEARAWECPDRIPVQPTAKGAP